MGKVKFNIKNVHYAVLTETEGAVSYATPKPIPGAVKMTVSPEGDDTEFFADGIVYYASTSNTGYSGSLEVADFGAEFKQDVWGYEKTLDGKLIEYADKEPKHVALLYEMDGSPEASRYLLYDVLIKRPTEDAETTTKTKEPKTSSAEYKARPLSSHAVKAQCDESDNAFSEWFKSVSAPERTPSV